jgi:cytochrome b561
MAYRYPPAARLLHWLTAPLLFAVVGLGVWITWREPKYEPLKFLLYDIHESSGVAVFALVLVRIIRRLAAPPAPLPHNVPRHFRAAAYANHGMLYATLLIQPIIGFLATNAWGFPLVWAGWVPIPSPLGKTSGWHRSCRPFTAIPQLRLHCSSGRISSAPATME